MKAMLKNARNEALYHYADIERVAGVHAGLSGNCTSLRGDCTGLSGNCTCLRGDCTGLRGDCTGLSGNCTGLRGDCTGLFGDCTDLRGDLDTCDISVNDRETGVDIAALVAGTGGGEGDA